MNVHLPTRRHTQDAETRPAVEFADLLDPVWSAPVVVDVPEVAAQTVLESAEEPITEPVVDPVVDPVTVSRFADFGIDDDRLPQQATTKRFRHR